MLRVCWGARGARSQFTFFGGCVCGSFSVWVSSGFRLWQGTTVGRDGGCGASRKCPVPRTRCAEPNSQPGRGSPRWNGMRAAGTGMPPPRRSIPGLGPGCKHSNPPVQEQRRTPKRKPRLRPSAGRTGLGSRVTPRRTLGIRKEQGNPTAKTSGTFNPGAPGRAFCSPRAEPRAPRRFRTPLPGRFHGNHTNMLISVLQPSRPQLIDRGDQPC